MNTQVPAYYRNKTAGIIEKYGPGPRIHFHSGYFELPGPAPETTIIGLRDGMAKAQDYMLAAATREWGDLATFTGRILDIGCGLGGSSIWLAQTYGARMIAITNVPEHLPIINTLATQAGVADKIHAYQSDAHTFADDLGSDGLGDGYDVAIAFESSCYFNRTRWFRALAKAVRPGGHVLIQDIFIGPVPGWKEFLDSYWHVDVGSVDDYRHAASAAGFQQVGERDISDNVIHFARWTIAWSELRARAEGADADQLATSIAKHREAQRAYTVGGLRTYLLAFELPPSTPVS